MAKKLITLAKEYDFNTELEYFNYIIESIVNGQRKQARELINKMQKKDKKEALQHFAQLEGNTYLGCYKEAQQFIIDSL